MPSTRTRRSRLPRFAKLTIAQELNLLLGGQFAPRPVFRSDAERRHAWSLHRDRLLRRAAIVGRPAAAALDYDPFREEA